MQIGKRALICAPPFRLGRRGQAGDDTDGHLGTGAVDTGLIQALCNGRGQILHNRGQEGELRVVGQHIVRQGDVAADHKAVHGQLIKIDIKLIHGGVHFRPNGFRRNTGNILAAGTADAHHGNVRQDAGRLIGQITQERKQVVGDTEFCAADAALRRAKGADVGQEIAGFGGLQQGVALLVGQAEPTALGVGHGHGVISPFFRRCCRLACRRRRRLGSLKAADFFGCCIDAGLQLCDSHDVCVALILKFVDCGIDSGAVLFGLRGSDIRLKLMLAGCEAVALTDQRLHLCLHAAQILLASQDFKCHCYLQVSFLPTRAMLRSDAG